MTRAVVAMPVEDGFDLVTAWRLSGPVAGWTSHAVPRAGR